MCGHGMQGRELLKAERAPFYQMQLRGQLGTERLQGDLQQDHWRHRMSSSGGEMGAEARL